MAVKTERLEMRLAREHKELLEQAAAMRGQPLTSFALSTLIEKAQDVLVRYQSTVLSLRDMKRFAKLIESDAEPNAALRAAAKRLKAVRG